MTELEKAIRAHKNHVEEQRQADARSKAFREHPAFLEMKRRLHANETLFVRYDNPDNDMFGIDLQMNVLKLTPIGNGFYNRLWRDETNSHWEEVQGEHDRNQVIEHMNPDVHMSIFQTEEEAIKYIAKAWKNEEN